LIVGAAVSTETLVGMAAAAGITAWTATPQGRKQIGTAIDETGKAIGKAFASQSIGPAQTCSKEATAENTKAEDDPGCNKSRGRQAEAQRALEAAEKSLGDFDAKVDPRTGIHPNYERDADLGTANRNAEEQQRLLREQAGHRRKLQAARDQARAKLDTATRALKACEDDGKKKQEEAEQQKRKAEEDARLAAKRARIEQKVNEQIVENGNITKRLVGQDGVEYKIGEHWMTREEIIRHLMNRK
jgi:hypothetical protein